MDLIPSAK